MEEFSPLYGFTSYPLSSLDLAQHYFVKEDTPSQRKKVTVEMHAE